VLELAYGPDSKSGGESSSREGSSPSSATNKPSWGNGRPDRLRTYYPKGCAGSNPVEGIEICRIYTVLYGTKEAWQRWIIAPVLKTGNGTKISFIGSNPIASADCSNVM
jgi:hypothetical protein